MKTLARLIVLSAGCLLLSACETKIPPEALQLAPDSLQNRQMQTRSFAMKDEKKLLSASMDVLQDLGFQLTESETKLGVIVANKKADAMEAGQVAGQVAMALLLGVYTPIDDDQLIFSSLVVTPSTLDKKKGNVRVIFSREVTNTQGKIARWELIVDPQIYQQFFSKLSKSVFLEENNI